MTWLKSAYDFRVDPADSIPFVYDGSPDVLPWSILEDVGDDSGPALRSAQISDGGWTSASLIDVPCIDGDFTLTYFMDSEANWDRFTITLDGEQILESSGGPEWRDFVFPILAGSHTFVFTYSKDASLSYGLDGLAVRLLGIPTAQDPATSFDSRGGGVASGPSQITTFSGLTLFSSQGGAVAGGTSAGCRGLTFLSSGGAVGGGRDATPVLVHHLSTGGGVCGGPSLHSIDLSGFRSYQISLQGNSEGLEQLAAFLSAAGIRSLVSPDHLSFLAHLEAAKIWLLFDLANPRTLRARQAINAGSESNPSWIYGTPVKLALRDQYVCPGWLMVREGSLTLASRPENATSYAYDVLHAGITCTPLKGQPPFLALLGSGDSQTSQLLPITTGAQIAVGVSMDPNTLQNPTILHLRSLASHLSPGTNGNVDGTGTVATEILVCSPTGKVLSTMQDLRGIGGSNVQPEQLLLSGSTSWLPLVNYNATLLVRVK